MLVLFAKAPIPGTVKTRLSPPLTPDEASSLHGSFVLDALERSKTAIQQQRLSLDRVIACAPSADHVFFQIVGERNGVGLIDQVGDDLGARMKQVVADMFARGYRRVLLLGTDLPSLPLTVYADSLKVLEQQDLVIGPAEDGGYYAIGMTRPVPELFDGIAWSTPQVYAQTRERIARAGLTVGELPRWRDVDRIEDLHALMAEAAADARKPKGQRTFSQRTAGTVQLLRERYGAG
ncbi:MAG: TIGR04282 family arsenosugar biosynthesis glycosyltransferase [Nitrospiraceae bacterium]